MCHGYDICRLVNDKKCRLKIYFFDIVYIFDTILCTASGASLVL